MAASDTGYLAHFLVAFKMESIWVSWKLNERQKKGVGIEIKRILCTDPQLITDVIKLRTTATQKSFLYYPLMGLRF